VGGEGGMIRNRIGKLSGPLLGDGTPNSDSKLRLISSICSRPRYRESRHVPILQIGDGNVSFHVE